MAKLVVEVLEASDLMPKDGHGSASPFVEVEVQDQRRRTSTKPKDLNPCWDEKLVFDIKNPREFHGEAVEVFVYNDKNKHGHHKSFLGKVRISGSSVPVSEKQAVVQRYPLDKRGIFSHVKGDIVLKIYAVDAGVDGFHHIDPLEEVSERVDVVGNRHHNHHHEATEGIIPPGDFDGGRIDDEYLYQESYERNKKKKKEKNVRRFYSLGTGGGGPTRPPAGKPFLEESRLDFTQAAPVSSTTTVMQMQFPEQKSEYRVVETKPPLAARMGYWGRDKIASTYDMVEQMNYLFVRVVKARDLPVKDITGSLDPYVVVKIGNYTGVTSYLEKNQDPVWDSVFAFSKEKLQSSLIEVTVKDKDVAKDDFVGRYVFDVSEVPVRVPPDSPLAPQWFRLEHRNGEILKRGEIMLAVWMGTQADEAFPEAWHSDAHGLSQQSLASTRSKVYFSPKMYYLRAHIISAQDLVASDPGRQPDTFVNVRLGGQGRATRGAPMKSTSPEWNEELIFIASEPFDEYIIFSVEDKVGGGKVEVIGRVIIPTREISQRLEIGKLPDAQWFALHKPAMAEELDMRREKFASRILLRLCIDAGYHVLDESTQFSSDLQPSSKILRKPSIGILEIGILSARNLLAAKAKEGKLTDAYCVAKYGNKWVRTRTLLDTLHPRWNEQYTWEVYDPCTVITIAVFDDCHVNNRDDPKKDQKLGKIRIRLSTLEIDRCYTHSYPLLVLTPAGLKKNGELHLALRFTCTAWVNMLTQYGRPLLPKMHYVQSISIRHIEWLRLNAMVLVASKLSRAEPPLRSEVVEYILDVDYQVWSLRRSKANFHRIMMLLSGISQIFKWMDGICNWKNAVTTVLVHVLFMILICYPELILPTIFLYLFVIGLWNFRFRPRLPPHMDARLSQAEDANPDELDEEYDTFPTSRDMDTVRRRYDRLRSVAGRVQTVLADLAMQGERVLSLLSWRDPRATSIFIVFALTWAVFLYVTPFQVVVLIFGLYYLRHPRFRTKLPPIPVNYFKRLTARADSLL